MAGRNLIESVEERMRRPDREVVVCGGKPGEMRVTAGVDGVTGEAKRVTIVFANGWGIAIDGPWARGMARDLGVDLQE